MASIIISSITDTDTDTDTDSQIQLVPLRFHCTASALQMARDILLRCSTFALISLLLLPCLHVLSALQLTWGVPAVTASDLILRTAHKVGYFVKGEN
jgi:hypothetical protein